MRFLGKFIGFILLVAAPALANNYLSFDGVDDWIEIPGGDMTITSNFTFECWAKTEKKALGGQTVISQGGFKNGFYFSIWPENDYIRLGNYWSDTGVKYPYGEWHHFAAVVFNEGTTFYIDGQQVAQGGPLPRPEKETPLRIGKQLGIYEEYWAGGIDEIRIWTGARTANEIRANMKVLQSTRGVKSKLIGRYSFDEALGNVVVDSAGGIGNGIMHNMSEDNRMPSTVGIAGNTYGVDYYVDASRPNDSGNGLTWKTAKKTIQAAVDNIIPGGTVWVTNGVYSVGGRATDGRTLPNRVCIDKAIRVVSVNGAEHTIIEGANAVRGVYVSEGANFSGFTITKGSTLNSGGQDDQVGGGIFVTPGTEISNCRLVDNHASKFGGGIYFANGGTLKDSTLENNIANYGGGAYLKSGGILVNCMIIENKAQLEGGGAFLSYEGGEIQNCTIVNNSATIGGGTACSRGGLIENTILWNNTAEVEQLNNWVCEDGGKIIYSCTTPDPKNLGGYECIIENPRISKITHKTRSSSPCIGTASDGKDIGVR